MFSESYHAFSFIILTFSFQNIEKTKEKLSLQEFSKTKTKIKLRSICHALSFHSPARVIPRLQKNLLYHSSQLLTRYWFFFTLIHRRDLNKQYPYIFLLPSAMDIFVSFRCCSDFCHSIFSFILK